MIEYLAMRICEGALNYEMVIKKIGDRKNCLDKALIERGREDLVIKEEKNIINEINELKN